jgi:class 3 adenylate cyclase
VEDDTSPEETRYEPERRWLTRNTSVATRLALSVLVISVVSLLVANEVSLLDVQDSSEQLLRERVSTIRGAKANEIEAYIEGAQIKVAELATSATTAASLRAFDDAYSELETLDSNAIAAESTALGAWYLDEFVPALTEVRGETGAALDLVSGGSPAAVYLQSKYIAETPLEIGEKELLTDAQDGSTWTMVHEDFHPGLRETVDRFAFADLYLIEPTTNAIVYSTGKDVDFATRLDTGPHRRSSLAQLVRRVTANPERGRVYVSDLASYSPALDKPSMFFAAPVFDGDELVGIVAARLSTTGIDALMTREWEQGRFGSTGETYLVGQDRRMRSVSRAFLEDQAGYFAAVEQQSEISELELSALDRRRAVSLGTTALLQEIDGPAVDAALAGDEGRIESTNYLGDEVYTAYQPLDIPDVDWVLVAEQERSEVDEPITDLTRDAFVLTAVFVVGLTFLIVIWANVFVSPLRRISNVIERIRRDELDTPVPSGGAREFGELASSFNQMVDDLHVRRERVSTALEGKMDVLRRLLPPAIVRRVEAGDRSMLETVPQATVVVLVVHGIDELARIRSVIENRELLHRVIDEFDALADINGLERVKVMADTYYGACGLSTPYLDHAPRSVTFALQASEFARRFASEQDADLSVSAGIQLGPVNVGLTGEARLIYDLWGETVTRAHELARTAGPGDVLVSDEIRDRLPEDRAVRPFEAAQGESSSWLVTGGRGSEGAET